MTDWHSPYGNDWDGQPDERIQGECCRANCHDVMQHRSLTCPGSGTPRGEDDWHDPFGSDWRVSDLDVQKECCVGYDDAFCEDWAGSCTESLPNRRSDEEWYQCPF